MTLRNDFCALRALRAFRAMREVHARTRTAVTRARTVSRFTVTRANDDFDDSAIVTERYGTGEREREREDSGGK